MTREHFFFWHFPPLGNPAYINALLHIRECASLRLLLLPPPASGWVDQRLSKVQPWSPWKEPLDGLITPPFFFFFLVVVEYGPPRRRRLRGLVPRPPPGRRPCRLQGPRRVRPPPPPPGQAQAAGRRRRRPARLRERQQGGRWGRQRGAIPAAAGAGAGARCSLETSDMRVCVYPTNNALLINFMLYYKLLTHCEVSGKFLFYECV